MRKIESLNSYPFEYRKLCKSMAETYDATLDLLNNVDSALFKLLPNYKKGLLPFLLMIEVFQNCRTVSSLFPSIDAEEVTIMNYCIDQQFTLEVFRDKNGPDYSCIDSSTALDLCIRFDNISPMKVSIAEQYYQFMKLMLTFFISTKNMLSDASPSKGLELLNRLAFHFITKINAEDKKIKNPITQQLFKEDDLMIKKNQTSCVEHNIEHINNIDHDDPQIKEKDDASSFNALIEELNGLIGLHNIKSDVKSLANMVKAQHTRAEHGFKTVPLSLHLVFAGNPGTGKTTVARIIAKIYKEIGVLKTGQLVEVDRSGLVAPYVGQTALKTQEKIEESIGGVLFIDEAYSLIKEGNDFGLEAVETLLKAMEDRRGEFIVIAAGYPELMERFINSNPGLRSRFTRYFYFPDYSESELYEIFSNLCKKYDYLVSDKAVEKIMHRIHQEKITNKENFANARSVRNLFEEIVTKQSCRVNKGAYVEDLSLIIEDDID